MDRNNTEILFCQLFVTP